MMEPGDLLKKITAMQAAAKGRLSGHGNEKMQVYVQGFCDGLDGVTATIKKAMEAERTRQRLARLESELAQEVEPDWSQVSNGMTESVPLVRDAGVSDRMTGNNAL